MYIYLRKKSEKFGYFRNDNYHRVKGVIFIFAKAKCLLYKYIYVRIFTLNTDKIN